jgi:hypothetical protein
MHTNVDLDQKHCLFPCKFTDLQFADWDTKEICRFAICGLIITICGLAHLADLRLRNELYLRTNKKVCVPILPVTRPLFHLRSLELQV